MNDAASNNLGYELWRALVWEHGWGRKLQESLAFLSDEEVQRLADELRDIWAATANEAARRNTIEL